MNDLIWVGNTLYPRWFVFTVLGMTILAMIGLTYALQMLVRRVLQRNRKIL